MMTLQDWTARTQGMWTNGGHAQQKAAVTQALTAFWNNLGATALPADRTRATAVRTAVDTAAMYGQANGFGGANTVAMRIALQDLSASAARVIVDDRALVILVAQALVDPYVTQRIIGQYANQAAQGAGFAQHLNAIFANTNTGHGQHQLQYWRAKGAQEAQRPAGSTLRCDGSAGIIVNALHGKIGGMRMEVCRQGNPVFGGGHWYVVLNRPVGANLTFGVAFPAQCITVDIWGAIHAGLPSAVVHQPPQAVFNCLMPGTVQTTTNHNNIHIVAPGAAPANQALQRQLQNTMRL